MSSVRCRRHGARALDGRRPSYRAPARTLRPEPLCVVGNVGAGTRVWGAHDVGGRGCVVTVYARAVSRGDFGRDTGNHNQTTRCETCHLQCFTVPWYCCIAITHVFFLRFSLASRLSPGTPDTVGPTPDERATTIISVTFYTRAARLDTTHARHVVRTHRTDSIKKGSAAKGKREV